MTPATGLCTWSLHNDLKRVCEVMDSAGLSHLHLEAAALETFKPAIKENNWHISAMMLAFPQEDYSSLDSIKATGGIVPDECWEQNLALALNAIELTASQGVPYLTTHAGFMDHNDPDAYHHFCSRIRERADAARDKNIALLLETGQESASDLRKFLEELKHPALGVNFDPANMILYGKGNPIEAIKILSPWIKHVHIKDATASPILGEWGQEVPWGEGDVDTKAFWKTLKEIDYSGATIIEREAGEQREADILSAAKTLEHNE